MPLNLIEFREKLYDVKACIDEKKVEGKENTVTTLKKKHFPVDLVVRKDGKIYVLMEILEAEILDT